MNRLGNLQLLEGPHNLAKSDTAPATWLAQRFPDAEQRSTWAATYDLGALSDEPSEFLAFYDDRRTRLVGRLSALLGVPAAEPAVAGGVAASQS